MSNFSDPFGLCAQSDTARVTVTVDCGDGTEGRREVLAVRVHADQLADVSSAASQLVGGTDDITPAKVARWYSLLASAGAIYSFPQKSDDGLWITTGAQTRTRFGIPTRVSLRVDVLRNLGHPLAAQVLGHEGAHMVDRSEGLGLTHEQIEAIIWRYKE